MNTNESDFFLSVMALDSNCPDMKTMRLIQKRDSKGIIATREREIEGILGKLSEILDQCIAKSETFHEWFHMLMKGAKKLMPLNLRIYPAFIIEAFQVPTGHVCMSIDWIKIPAWSEPKYTLGLWHRRKEHGGFIQFDTISWVDDQNILTYLRRFPTDIEGFARSIYCPTLFPPLFD